MLTILLTLVSAIRVLFTQDFKKFRVALGAVTATVLLYVGINASFITLSQRVESKSDVYPYHDEDWLRYMLPGLFQDRGYNRIMLVGESAVLEGLLYEEFNRAFPKLRTFHGELSAATLDDLLISLDYIEKVYGRNSLPRVLVLGISPRFVANFPEGRFFLEAIQRYSPSFAVEQTSAGPRLVPKTFWQGWLSWLRFIINKQQERYLAALTVLARNLVLVDSTESALEPLSPRGELLRFVVLHPLKTARQVFRAVVDACNRRWALPYKFHDLPPFHWKDIREVVDNPESFVRRKVYRWNPEESRPMIADRFRRLRDLIGKKNILLYVFSVPERAESRQLYEEKNYQRYVALVRENLGDTRYLDLRKMLNPWEFNDLVHPSLPGARRVTERVIRFIREHHDGMPELAG